MRLYQVSFDGQHRWVEAESMESAVSLWRNEWELEILNDHPSASIEEVQDPESCTLIAEEVDRPVVLRAPATETHE